MKSLDGKSLLQGLGRALDIRGGAAPRYRRKATWIPNDSSALAADWNAVLGDLGAAYTRVRRANEGR